MFLNPQSTKASYDSPNEWNDYLELEASDILLTDLLDSDCPTSLGLALVPLLLCANHPMPGNLERGQKEWLEFPGKHDAFRCVGHLPVMAVTSITCIPARYAAHNPDSPSS